MQVVIKGIKMSTVNIKIYMHVWGQGHTPILPSHLKNSVYTFPYTSYQASVIAILRRYRLNFYPKDVANINTFEPHNNNGIEIPVVGNSGELAASIF